MNGPAVGIDATPLASAHAVRGIGRYLGGVLAAVLSVEPDWSRRELGMLLLRDQPAISDGVTWRTMRARKRPQDLDPLVALLADRVAIRRHGPGMWQQTDPTIPWSPLRDARTIVTVYDLIPLREPTVLARMRLHRRAAYRRWLGLVRRSAGVIAISPSAARDVTELLGVPADRIRIVPPHIAATRTAVRADPTGASARSGSTDIRPRFLFVGVPDPHKRAGLAVDAFARLVHQGVEAELVFAGVHPPAIRTVLRDRLGAAGVVDRVRFADRVDDAELDRLYRGSILLATSSIEGFGLPVVEAILAGGRVVTTPTRAYRDAVGDLAITAVAATPDSLATAMATATTAGPASALERAELAGRYDAPTVATAILTAYGELASS